MTTPSIGFARTGMEIQYWLRLRGCPSCGERELGETRLFGTGILSTPNGKSSGGMYAATCPRCGHHREVEFFEAPNFNASTHRGLGGPEPSTIISPREFSEELRRLLALIPEELPEMDTAVEELVLSHRSWGEKSASELLKFIPAGEDEIPDAAFGADVDYKRAHAAELTRGYLDSKVTFFWDYLERVREQYRRRAAEREAAGTQTPGGRQRLPLPAFSLASLKLHEQWLGHPDEGDNQQLIARGADATEMQMMQARNLSRSIMDKVTLDRTNLAYTSLDEAQLKQVSLRAAILDNGSANHATIDHCNFEGAEAQLWKLGGAQLTDCNFTGTALSRSVWTRAAATRCVFRAADLRNARLDEARLTDCDFRDADLSVPDPGVNTTREARFVRCDLRGVNWEGRDLEGARFIDCLRD